MAQQVKGVDANTIGGMIDRLHMDLGVPRADILASLHLREKDIARWHATGTNPSAATVGRLQILVALRDGLQEMFAGPEGVYEWMHAELRDLQWRTPQQALCEGDVDGVYAAFEGLASGIYL